MKSDKRDSITILVCANGYEVIPAATHNVCIGYTSESKFVFESFDNLTTWLKENLKEPDAS